MALAFARQLREGTKKSHTMAENTGFISCFLKGVVDKSSYRNLLADLYFVYSAMEEEIEKLCKNSHPIISPIGFKELFRKEKLEQDLSFYFGSNWSELVKPSKPALEYEARIREIEEALSLSTVIEYKDFGNENIVKFGSLITILDLDSSEKKTYQIVGEFEADIDNNTISITTPIGKALLKKETGDVVEVDTPSGLKEFEILEIKIS